MASITQIKQIKKVIDKFSKQNFKFLKFIELLLLVKNIPESVNNALNDIDLIYHIDEAHKHISWITDYFDRKINPAVRSAARSLGSKDRMQEYADFTVDSRPPVFRKPESQAYRQMSFDDYNREHLEKHGEPIKEVRRRNGKQISYKGVCPGCGAGSQYLYDNNGKGRQFRCKVCSTTFTENVTRSDEVGCYCPYCNTKMMQHHDRCNYIVYRCENRNCSYYKERLAMRGTDQADSLKTSSNQELLHYHYREFKFTLDKIRNVEDRYPTPSEAKEDRRKLSRIYADQRCLGLILSYYVNYGLSARKTALIMNELYGYRISHQTVVNYARLVSRIIQPMVDLYPYRMTSTQCGDETYIKVRGINKYVFLWSDTTTRIITSYRIYDQRDTLNAVKSIHDVLMHYDEIPDDLVFITDGNPIYNAAQLFYRINGIDFELHQVIGVKNRDAESKKWRPHKQREERLNRTYKQNYYGTNGYDGLEGANRYMVLYVAFYNFLRRHSSLGNRTPVDDHLFDDCALMHEKWLKLIEMSTDYAMQF